MNIDIKNAEITALVDALFAGKVAKAPVVVDSVDAALGATLIQKLLNDPGAVVVHPAIQLNGSILNKEVFVVDFQSASTMIDAIDPMCISTVTQEDDMRSWITIWFGEGRKLVIEFDGWMYNNAWFKFVKDTA